MIINEQINGGVGSLVDDKTQLPPTVLCRVTYPICNLGVLNKNKRMYESSVFEGVLADPEIQDKLQRRTLFGEIEHPVSEMVTRLDRPITHTTHALRIDEGSNKVFADLDILDTPAGRIIGTLLRAGCDVGVSTRASGDLDEAVDESGGKFFKVNPTSYKLKAIDFTADESTFGALPEKVLFNVVDSVKEGVIDGSIQKLYAVSILESCKTDSAKELIESYKQEIAPDNSVVEGKLPDPNEQDITKVVQDLVENDVKPEDYKVTQVSPNDNPVNRIGVKIIFDNGDSLYTEINTDLAGAEKYYLGKVFNIGVGENDKMAKVVKVEEIKEAVADEGKLPDPNEQDITKVVQDLVEQEITTEGKLPDPNEQDITKVVQDLVENVIDDTKKIDMLRSLVISETKHNTELIETLDKITEVNAKLSTEITELKSKLALETSVTADLVKTQEAKILEMTKVVSDKVTQEITESLAKKQALDLKVIIDSTTKKITESVTKSIIGKYVSKKMDTLGVKFIPSNALTLLEHCTTIDEVDQLMGKLQKQVLEMVVHSTPIADTLVVESVEKSSDKQAAMRSLVKSALDSMIG